MRNALFFGILALAVLGLAAPAAEAHPRILSLYPAANASVVRPEEIRLIFSEQLVGRFSSIELTDDAGNSVSTGPMTLSGDRKQIAVFLPQRLARGVYRVSWRVVSRDTHRVKGTYKFKVSA